MKRFVYFSFLSNLLLFKRFFGHWYLIGIDMNILSPFLCFLVWFRNPAGFVSPCMLSQADLLISSFRVVVLASVLLNLWLRSISISVIPSPIYQTSGTCNCSVLASECAKSSSNSSPSYL